MIYHKTVNYSYVITVDIQKNLITAALSVARKILHLLEKAERIGEVISEDLKNTWVRIDSDSFKKKENLMIF